MAYKKVSLPDMFKFEKDGEQLEGIYTDHTEHVGENDSNVYRVRLDNGDEVGFWGTTVLDGQMRQVKVGMKIRITFLGMKPSPNRKGKEYRDFEVEYDDEQSIEL